MFRDMGRTIRDRAAIDADGFLTMLQAGLSAVTATGAAKVGDKTLIDCLDPAIAAFDAARQTGSLRPCGRWRGRRSRGATAPSTWVAKLGRAARLAERSRGVPDAGATSCCLILTTLADSVERRLSQP